MKLEHLAVWCRDLEKMRTFYTTVFQASSNERYVNPNTGFHSYFLTFPTGGARLELMQMPGIEDPPPLAAGKQAFGLAHLAIQVGSKSSVDDMVSILRASGCNIIRGPRTTGDGYYEVEAFDIEGNRLEITA